MNQTEHSISSEESPLGTAPIGQLLKNLPFPALSACWWVLFIIS